MPTVLASLNHALHQAFTHDPHVVLLGEDILDPYGGAFKVTQSLSTAFPDRVLTSPISEAGVLGLATGMALRGLRPVVEIMFGDFVTLIADQVINHAAKFRWMYNDQVRVPLVIRTPMGGRRGYGPTHSQTLEKLFLGIPGIRVLAPCDLGDPGRLLLQAILDDDDPVLFVENKLLYPLALQDVATLDEFELTQIPLSPSPETTSSQTSKVRARQDPVLQRRDSYAFTYVLRLRGAPPPTSTLAVYGYMTELARQAALRLAYEREVFVEMVVPTQLAPFEIEPILASVKRTTRLLAIEEGTHDLGWGAEILARAAEALGPDLRVARRLAAQNLPIPASRPLEEAVLPGVEQIIETCLKVSQAVHTSWDEYLNASRLRRSP